jgi:predicted MFS family arabinose efflux permease
LNKFLRWTLLFSGIGIMIGMIIFGVTTERVVPAGADLGLELFYVAALLIGGLLIYLSTAVKRS